LTQFVCKYSPEELRKYLIKYVVKQRIELIVYNKIVSKKDFPSIDDIVQAYGKKFGYQIQVNPPKAANLLGLSQQVPAKNIYLTDGPNRSLTLNGQTVILKHVCPRKLLGIGTKAGLIVQALYAFGAKSIDKLLTAKLKALIDQDDKKKLQEYLVFMPGWMQKIMDTLLK